MSRSGSSARRGPTSENGAGGALAAVGFEAKFRIGVARVERSETRGAFTPRLHKWSDIGGIFSREEPTSSRLH